VTAFLVARGNGLLRGGSARVGRMQALRHGFFDAVDAELAACDELIQELPMMQTPAVGVLARARQWSEWSSARHDWTWTYVGDWVSQLQMRESSHLFGLSELRLLRLALAFELGEPLPDLVDPVAGGPFDVRIDGNVASFRSSANVDAVRWAERRH
jgi:hypothetical protein